MMIYLSDKRLQLFDLGFALSICVFEEAGQLFSQWLPEQTEAEASVTDIPVPSCQP